MQLYKNNPNLKAKGVVTNYTNDQVAEYIKCAKDCEYFLENYVKIVHVDRGLVPFEMYDFQKKMVDTFVNNRFIINKLPRQSGKSTTVVGYILWVVLFHDNQSIAILANKGALARDMLAKIQLAYEHLPKWLQQGVIGWNKGDIELENGSKIKATSTSSSAARGGSYNLIFLDEFAFVGNNLAEEFFSSVYPTISSGETTQVIIVSTPNGMNHFYRMWVDAVEGRSKYVFNEVHWSEVPGRDEDWKAETIANTSEEQFAQEFECEFLGSTNTLISAAKLRSLAWIDPIATLAGEDFKCYEQVKEGHSYIITVDTSHGKGLDYSAFSCIDVTEMPFKMVGRYYINYVSPLLYPSIIVDVAEHYNNAYILCEINDIGQQVANIIHHDLEYEHLFVSAMRGRAGQVLGAGRGQQMQLGVRTTSQVKRIGCANLKDLIEHDKLIIQDYETIVELSTFAAKGQSYEAEEGSHDDLVMTLVLFGWLAKQPYFQDLTQQDIRARLYQDNMKMIEEDMLPFGIIDDGSAHEASLLAQQQADERETFIEEHHSMLEGDYQGWDIAADW